jgi:exo-beta-1,3-glucanase (GH17 family)
MARNETFANKLRRYPKSSVVALAATAALAGCSSSNENSTNEVTASTKVVSVGAKPHESQPADQPPEEGALPDKEAYGEGNKGGDVASLIKEMIDGNYTGGNVVAHEDNEKAGDVIINDIQVIADQLPVPIDDVETVIRNAEPDTQLVIIEKDPSSPESEWKHITAKDEVPINTGLTYQFVAE